MRALVFGALEFNRKSIPAELKVLETWPTVDHTALATARRDTFCQRAEAIRLFVLSDDVSLVEIEARTGVPRQSFFRLFSRCIERHPDGRIHGFRALVPHVRLKSYIRRTPVRLSTRGGNASGALSQLLARY